MKHAIIAGVLVVAFASVAHAQGTNIHSRLGESGATLSIGSDTQLFHYEATVSGTSVAYVATLEVYHNGILKSVQSQLGAPIVALNFSAQVDMASWGLRAGDHVTFRLKVVSIGLSQQLLATHSLTGEVIAATTQTD